MSRRALKRNSTEVAVDQFVLAIKGEKKCHTVQIVFFARLLSPIRSSKGRKSSVDFESVPSKYLVLCRVSFKYMIIFVGPDNNYAADPCVIMDKGVF